MSASETPERLLRRLEWTVLRRLDGLLHGDYRTLFRGVGLDLADLREYQYQDDVRHIDWNVTARLQVPYVREFQEDRELAAWFLVDLSGSIDFGSGPVRKRALATEFVTLLARMLAARGNRAGAMLYRTRVDATIAPRSGRRHVLTLAARMMAAPTPARAARPPRTPAGAPALTDLRDLFVTADQTIRRRSLVFVVSDFISAPGWDAPLARLAQRHEVIAIRLYDPLEMELPDLGGVLMQDAESGEQLWVDTHDPAFRRRFARAAARREAALRTAFAGAGVDVLEVAAGEDLADAVLRFAQMRRRRAQLAGGGRWPAHLSQAAA
jgi:uncharacterized protein (DUF58 family)